MLDVLGVLQVKINRVVVHVLLELGQWSLHVELIEVSAPRLHDLEVNRVVIALHVRVDQLLVAKLLLFAVDGHEFVFSGDKSVAVGPGEPKLGFLGLIKTEVIVFLLINGFVFFAGLFISILDRAGGAVTERDCFKELAHMCEGS